MRKFDPFVKDQRRFHAAIGNEGAAFELRQTVSVLCHCEVSPSQRQKRLLSINDVLTLIRLSN